MEYLSLEYGCIPVRIERPNDHQSAYHIVYAGPGPADSTHPRQGANSDSCRRIDTRRAKGPQVARHTECSIAPAKRLGRILMLKSDVCSLWA